MNVLTCNRSCHKRCRLLAYLGPDSAFVVGRQVVAYTIHLAKGLDISQQPCYDYHRGLSSLLAVQGS